MTTYDVLEQILAGLEEEKCVRPGWSGSPTASISVAIGKTAAGLSGSGIGVGLQAKGTTLIHRRPRPRWPTWNCS